MDGIIALERLAVARTSALGMDLFLYLDFRFLCFICGLVLGLLKSSLLFMIKLKNLKNLPNLKILTLNNSAEKLHFGVFY